MYDQPQGSIAGAQAGGALGKAYLGEDPGPAMPPRPQRLDILLGAGDENLKNASQILSKLRAVRERLSGSWPEAAGKDQNAGQRSGHLGRLEDQALDLHKVLTAIGELADHLLGV